MAKSRVLKPLIVIVSIAIIVLAFLNCYQKNAIASVPDSFCVCAGEQALSASDWNNKNYDLKTIELENGKKTYHINVSEQYLSSDGAYVYVTGRYWDSLFKPDVFVNGQKAKVRRTGFDYYHFYIYDVIPDYKYEINIFCGEKSDYINIVFHYE